MSTIRNVLHARNAQDLWINSSLVMHQMVSFMSYDELLLKLKLKPSPFIFSDFPAHNRTRVQWKFCHSENLILILLIYDIGVIYYAIQYFFFLSLFYLLLQRLVLYPTRWNRCLYLKFLLLLCVQYHQDMRELYK